MAKNPHKPFNKVIIDDGPEVLECRPMFDNTMVVRKPLPAASAIPVVVDKSTDLVAPEAVNKKDKKLDLLK